LKILYVSPEHVSGGFDFFVQGHLQRGNTARYITFFRSQFGFNEDLCFDLALMPNTKLVQHVRKFIKRANRVEDIEDLKGNPPYWKPTSKLSSWLMQLRDQINSGRIRAAISAQQLNDYDIYHFEQGIDVYRDGRWIKSLADKDKGIVCFYHGSDIRNRGVMENVHRYSELNLTSEIDLMSRMDGMKYLYLPIDTDSIIPDPRPHDGRIRICHAARNRFFKGTDHIEPVVIELKKTYPIDWVMLENMKHEEALKVKAKCDIFIDQITDKGGWGYGASSVESLALGLPTMTLINPEVDSFLESHPFVSTSSDNLLKDLIQLLEDSDLRREYSRRGREWVVKHHSIDAVMYRLYGYYKDVGFM